MLKNIIQALFLAKIGREKKKIVPSPFLRNPIKKFSKKW